MHRRSLLGSAAALALAPTLAATPAGAQLARMRFCCDFAYQGNHAVWALGIDRGLFEREGLNVTMDRGYGSGDTIVKVAAGAYDIGFADINALVKFNAQNPDKRCIAVYQVFDRTLSAIISLSKANIRTPADLAGKTLGAPDADASRLLFPVFAAKNSLDPASVSWKSMAPSLRETILVQGQVDAISGFTTTSYFNLLAAGVKPATIEMMTFADHGLDLYGSAVIVREDMLAARPKDIAGFVRGTIGGTKLAIADPTAGMAALQKRDTLFDAELEMRRFDMALKDAMLTPYVRQNGFGSIDPARMALTIAANATAFGLATPPSAAEIYTTQFLPPQAERMAAQP